MGTEKRSPGKTEVMKYGKCQNFFSRKIVFDRHVLKCGNDRTEKSGDSIEEALEVAHDLVYGQNELVVYNRYCTNP